MDDKNIADAFSAWFSSPVPIREHHADAMEYLIILGEESSDYDDVVDAICFRAGYKAALSTIDPEAIRRECADRYCKNVCAWPSTEWEHPDECECSQRAAILADEPKEREEERSVWSMVEDGDDDLWSTSCGQEWIIEGDPIEGGYKYCPNCGAEVERRTEEAKK